MIALAVHLVQAVAEIDEQSLQAPGEVGLQGQPAVAGICRLGETLAYVIDGQALTLQATEVAGAQGTVTC